MEVEGGVRHKMEGCLFAFPFHVFQLSLSLSLSLSLFPSLPPSLPSLYFSLCMYVRRVVSVLACLSKFVSLNSNSCQLYKITCCPLSVHYIRSACYQLHPVCFGCFVLPYSN